LLKHFSLSLSLGLIQVLQDTSVDKGSLMHLFINIDLTAFPLALIDDLVQSSLDEHDDLTRVQLQIRMLVIFLELANLVQEHVVVHNDIFVD
jgi:hypothetical protein